MESSIGFCFISSPVFLCCFSLLADVPPVVQIESLKCFSYLCSCGNNEWLNRIFSSFPVLLVPMSSANQVTPEVFFFNGITFCIIFLFLRILFDLVTFTL